MPCLARSPPYGAGAQPMVLRNRTTRTIPGVLSAGLSDQAIARRLACSERTVQRHILQLTEAL
jgi:DNA-binding NarL/FixJ family response regulator